MKFEEFLPLILGLVIICALLLGFYWILKKMTSKTNKLSSGRYAKILDRIPISQDKQIQLIEISDYVLVVGITASSITLLLKIKKDQLKLFEQDSANTQFKDVLSGFLMKSKDNERKL
jgi:flagellar biosynthetic protein FliO